ncbi:MAG: hypothetical protein LBK03_04535 [Bacteroidales bacterium]|jgi:hypothetical protein|nr:hypothetical protein [Bacteroidales bacterium]
MAARKKTDRQLLAEWEQYYSQFITAGEIDESESAEVTLGRRKKLEANPEEWFAYYFAGYCKSPAAPFHRAAARRLLANNHWYEVRSWCRGMAKSARSMMEIVYLALTGQVKNVLIVSATYDSAVKLLTPFRLEFEQNLRIAQDYEPQQSLIKWEAGDLITKCGCAFQAIGAGQSPRGVRNKSKRPDFILVDDIDTDEECRNPDRIKTKWDWIEQALIPTLDISENIRILFNGNIIAKDSCIVRAGKIASHWDIINIRDKHGKSTWPEKNSEEQIDFILSKISTRSAQQEYFNNPLTEGTVFKEITYGKVPPLNTFRFLVCYGDPSPSNSRNPKSSRKAAWLVGIQNAVTYVIKGKLDHATNAEFVAWFYEINRFVGTATQVYNHIENNTLQDPMFQQVIMPLFVGQAKTDSMLSVSPDTRKKPDKFSRIEGNLEPLNRQARLVFNEAMKGDPHMQRLAEEFLLITPELHSPADGADCVEGAYWIANSKIAANCAGAITKGRKPANRKRV